MADVGELLDGRLCRPVLLTGALAALAFLFVPNDAVQTVATAVPFVLTVVLLGMRVRAASGEARRRLFVLWTASLTYMLAMVWWYLSFTISGAAPDFPSPLDAVFFAVFGAYIWFLAVVQRGQAEKRSVDNRLALVDSLILTTTVCAVLGLIFIPPNLDTELSAGVRIVSLLYPALSTVMFGLAARIATSASFLRSRSGALMLLWVTAEVTGDVIYGVTMANGTYLHTSWVTALWIVAYTALAALAAHPDTVRLVDPSIAESTKEAPRALGTVTRRVSRVVPIAAALVPLVIAVLAPHHAVVMLAAGLISFTLVGYRSHLLSGDLREERRLTRELDAAVARLGEQRDELQRLAFQDPLTGLGNRALFHQRMTEVVGAAGLLGGRKPFALLMIDLDDFKVVNDSLGHDTGDQLLTAVSARLTTVLGGDGTVTRLGGDEFGVVLPGASEAQAVAIAERMVAELARPFEIGARLLHTAASVGVATETAGDDVEAFLRSSDLAMYAAKAAGKGTVRVFESVLLDQAQERLLLESHLRHAIERDELSLAYQPIFDARSGALDGLEALARWTHRQWGAVGPDRFVPVAAATGVILPLGEWVLRTACRDAAELGRRRAWPLGVAVNVSVRQMQSTGFIEVVRSALSDAGLAPELLTVEVTESLIMDDDARSAQAIADLHAMGVRLSIDDFGTGYSSLARLRQLPVTELKIDRSLVWQITEDNGSRPIAAAVMAMAGALGLTVVAEGVETEGQLEALRELGCDLVQGYLLAVPARLDELVLDDPAVAVSTA